VLNASAVPNGSSGSASQGTIAPTLPQQMLTLDGPRCRQRNHWKIATIIVTEVAVLATGGGVGAALLLGKSPSPNPAFGEFTK
jgi:hypothetical protein